ncbi:uncharacterized protein LOC118936246 isoform X2 [Oncorhynchus mykiss]|uniref:uncharacterized protein LOC118936246 isoform X2 n=1 Tax=Oncorhynchus mykiss TaxID=8022 RepID=UPI001878CCDA|nr:uncharacterized protein LOC118936246 isoform X2 [Oncorhynchus mykiss]
MPSWIRLTVLLSALTVHCFLDGTCPRRDPPPRVLVVSPGSVLVLACSGQVEVNGLEVTVNRAKHTSTIAGNGKYTGVITGVHPSTVSTTTNTTSNGTTVSTTTDTTSNGTTVSTTTDTTSNGTTVSTTTDTTSNGTTVSTTTDTTSNGTTVSTTTDTTSNGTTVSTTTDTTSNGTTVSTTTDTTSNGTTVSTTTDTTSNGTTVSTTTDTTSNGTTVSTTTDTTSNGTTVSTTTDTTSNGTTVSTTTDTTSNGTTVSTTTDTTSNGTTVSTTTDTTSNGTTVSTTTDTTSNGTTVSAIKDNSDNGTTVSAIKDDSDNGTTVSAIKDSSDNRTTVSTIKDSSDNGTTVSTIKDSSDNGTTVSTIKDGSDNGTTVSTIKDSSDNGTTVSTIKDGSDNGTTVSTIKDSSDNGTTVSTIKDGSDNGTTVSAIKDGSDNGIDTFSTGKDTIVLTVTDTPVTDDTGTDSREKPVIRNTRAGNHTPLTVREVNKGNVEDVTEEEHKGGGEQRDTGRSLYTVNQSGHTDTQKLFPLTGTSLQPTRDSGVGGADTELSSNRWTDAMDSEDDYEEEEEGGRMVRGLRGRSQWRLNGRPLRGGEERGGVVVLGRRGATLTLPSLAVGDSGNYSCHRGGKLVSSLRVSVAVPPERPKLSCYKRSPSSKIRCDWTASQPVTPVPQCYLLLRKGLSGSFSRVNCSYSALLSRCWCAIGHQEKESREPHLAYLCVTNTAGNTTSPLLDFTPLDIIHPDPPSSVVVRGVEGQERRLRVGWAVPHSWKERDRYHELLYELRYHTMPHGTQIKGTTTAQFYTITDALPGVQYLIQLRAKEEFDGHWSEWSTAVYANTWTAPVPTAFSDLSTVMDYTDDTDSGSGMTEETSVSESRGGVEVWPHVLWVVASCVLLSITLLSTYLYRHRERFMSKLWRLSPVSSSPACPSPPVTTLPTQEGHALVNFDHPIYGEPVPREEERKEEDEEEEEEEKVEVIRFNNTSYFLVQSK